MEFTNYHVILRHRGYKVTHVKNKEKGWDHWYAQVWVIEGHRAGHYRMLREGKTKTEVIKMAKEGIDYKE